METTRFPLKMGGDLAGKTFAELLNNDPKTVEFVDALWTPVGTTGIFSDFYEYIKTKLKNPIVKQKHCERARQFVLTIPDKEIPSYLTKYMASK